MSKKNQAKKEEVKEVEVVAVLPVEGAEDLAPKLSTYIAYAEKRLAEITPGHREIDIAVKDAVAAIEKAVDLVKFIENIQATVVKKK